jgi:lysophospholipase L1-like esterase
MRRLVGLVAIATVTLAGACSAAPGASVESGSAPAQAEGASNDGRTVWAIGDSIMVSATDRLTEQLPGVVLDAEVGRTFRAGLDALAGLLDEADAPDVLIFALGTNNGASPTQIAELAEVMVDVDEIILVNVVVPRGWETATNESIASAAASDGQFIVVDWWSAAGRSTGLFRSDGYHPNADGLDLWTDLVTDAAS